MLQPVAAVPAASICRLQVHTDGTGGAGGLGGEELWRPATTAEIRRGQARPAWAALILAEVEAGPSLEGSRALVGLLGARLPGEPSAGGASGPLSIDDLGQLGATSAAAEVLAAVWGLLAAAEWAESLGRALPVELVADSRLALQLASGEAGSRELQRLGGALRGAALWWQHEGGGFACRHVLSHCGHPWNEAVDSIAGAAGADDIRVDPEPRRLAAYVRGRAAEWEWFPSAVARDPRRWPALTAEGAPCAAPQQLACAPRSVAALMATPARQPLAPGRWAPSLATANVLSLEARWGEEQGVTGRMQLLSRAFEEASVTVVGIQESRRPGLLSTSVGNFRVLGSSATPEGHYGCQLWIARSAGVDLEGLAISHSSPRLLVVSSRLPALSFVVAHAPSAAAGGDAKGYWREVTDVLRRQSARTIVLLADANATLGSMQSRGVGPVHAEAEGPGGRAFRAWLEVWDLALPSTFLAQAASGITWTAPDGRAQHRLDYVGVPARWLQYVTYAEVLQEVDLALGRPDHMAAVVRLQGIVTSRRRGRKPPRLALSSLREPPVAEVFAKALRSARQPAWSASIQRHAHCVQSAIQKALTAACPPRSAGPRQEWAGPLSVEVAAAKSSLYRALRAAGDPPAGPRRGGAQAADRGILHARLRSSGEAAAQAARSLLASEECWLRPGPLRAALAAAADSSSALLRSWPGPPADMPPGLSVTLWALHSRLSKGLKRRLRRDRLAHVAEQADKVGRAFEDGRLGAAHAGLRRLRASCPGAKRARPLPAPMVLMADGTPAATAAARQQRWLRYFGDIEGASYHAAGEFLDALAEGEVASARPSVRPAPQVLPPELLISRTELEELFRRVPRGKAAGPDGIPPDALSAAPAALAELAHPLFLKLAEGREPVEFKGGRMVAVWKGKGSPAVCANSRAILLSSTLGKVWHRALRDRLVGKLRDYVQEASFGLGGGADMASHFPRAAAEWAKSRGLGAAFLFLDLRSAYYSVWREMALPPVGEDAIERVLHRLAPSPDAVAAVRELLHEPGSLHAAGLSPPMVAMIAEAFRGTWFAMDGAEEIAWTRRGSRPGDPLADALFAFVAARALEKIRGEMRAAGLLWEAPWHASDLPLSCALGLGETPFSGPSRPLEITDGLYADDDVIPIFGPPPELPERLVAAAAVTARWFPRFGLDVNFEPGKTEAVIRTVGKGARRLAERLEEAGQALAVPRPDGTVATLRCVPQYRHMGALFDRKGAERPEMARRRAECAAARRSLQPFLRSSCPPIASRVAAVRSVCLGSLLTNAAIWGRCDSASIQLLEAEFDRCLRAAAHAAWDGAAAPSAAHLRALLSEPSVEDHIHAARLRYLPRLLLRGPRQLLALIQGTPFIQNKWLRLLTSSLDWLWAHSPSLADCPSPGTSFAYWEELARTEPRRWKSWVGQALRSAGNQHGLSWAGRRAEADIATYVLGHSVPGPAIAEAACRCDLCGLGFPDLLRLRKHNAAVHEHRQPARQYARDGLCGWCGRDYRTRPRGIRHLWHDSPECLHNLRLTVPPCLRRRSGGWTRRTRRRRPSFAGRAGRPIGLPGHLAGCPGCAGGPGTTRTPTMGRRTGGGCGGRPLPLRVLRAALLTEPLDTPAKRSWSARGSGPSARLPSPAAPCDARASSWPTCSPGPAGRQTSSRSWSIGAASTPLSAWPSALISSSAPAATSPTLPSWTFGGAGFEEGRCRAWWRAPRAIPGAGHAGWGPLARPALAGFATQPTYGRPRP